MTAYFHDTNIISQHVKVSLRKQTKSTVQQAALSLSNIQIKQTKSS